MRRFRLSLFAALAFCLQASPAESAPSCDAASLPTVYRNPWLTVGVWSRHGEAVVPPCADAEPRPSLVLVEAEGRFTEAGGVAALVARLAALDRYRDIRYWSVTRSRWRELVSQAQRPDGHGGWTEGPFAPADLAPGVELRFRQDENTPAGRVVYRLSVEQMTPDRLDVLVVNARPVTFLGMTLFAPGEYRFHHSFRRIAGDQWDYRGQVQVLGSVDYPFGDRGPSYANRAEGTYRYLAGLPAAGVVAPVAPE